MSRHHSPPTTRATNLRASTRLLLGRLRPERGPLSIVIALITVSVTLAVIAPRVLGRAVDLIYAGYLGAKLPADADVDALVAQAQQQGRTNYADMLANSGVVPGASIDFHALGQLIALLIGMYVVAALFQWGAGYLLNLLVMRVVYRLREEVETKIHTLPLAYFDSRQRGDIMSRVTNDVDNVQNALQQGFSQGLNSLLRVVGIAAMMFIVSWHLALIALIALPLSVLVAGVLGSKSRARFSEQWRQTGRVNGHIEETFSGLELVRAFGRADDMLEEFDRRNEALYRSAFSAQFLSGAIMPLMQFVSFLSYVLIAVAGALRVASGHITLGDATAFIQYSREFSQPLSQLGGLANMILSGVASFERCHELLDADEQTPDQPSPTPPREARGHVEFRDVTFSYTPQTSLIHGLTLDVAPGQTVAIVGPTGAGKTTLVNLIMRFYELDAGQILIDGVDTATMTRAAVRTQVGMVLQDAV
ncbi:MAG TPA: ABC transporter ATP-binding protein, partial [Beutenbergiaceae bacterium]|nr:ABC transporter ATP-binding protein [Beutenbergiaceae bacterium]